MLDFYERKYFFRCNEPKNPLRHRCEGFFASIVVKEFLSCRVMRPTSVARGAKQPSAAGTEIFRNRILFILCIGMIRVKMLDNFWFYDIIVKRNAEARLRVLSADLAKEIRKDMGEIL